VDWRSFFPEAEPREIQTQILDFVTDNFDDADAFFIEAPPGVGKSAIALTLARWFEARTRAIGAFKFANEARSYITTTTIALEDQYMRSYASRGLVQLHSAAWYPCTRKDKKTGENLTCEEGNAVTAALYAAYKKERETPWEELNEREKEERKIRARERDCPGMTPCPYGVAKGRFMERGYGVVNAPYLFTESIHAGQLGRRGLLISDEGHTLAETICGLVEFKIEEKKVQSLGLIYPRVPESENEIPLLMEWARNEYQPALLKREAALKQEIRKHEHDKDDTLLVRYSKELRIVSAEIAKIRDIVEDVNATAWVLERGANARGAFLVLTPLSASAFSRRILAPVAPKLVLLSATFIDFDYHAFELGVDPARLGIHQAPSPFPKEHRPIYVSPRVRLDYRDVAASCAEAAHYIAPIVDGHPGQRGIIFVSSYAQAWGIVHAVNALTGGNRLQSPNGSAEKALLLKMHAARPDSVLVSPSMHEGIDLKDDLSRFQIITKLPFPNLGSKIVQGRMETAPTWYAYTTVLKLIQATGRSVRTETDRASTYILDAAFGWFYKRNRNLFPVYWQEAVKFI